MPIHALVVRIDRRLWLCVRDDASITHSSINAQTAACKSCRHVLRRDLRSWRPGDEACQRCGVCLASVSRVSVSAFGFASGDSAAEVAAAFEAEVIRRQRQRLEEVEDGADSSSKEGEDEGEESTESEEERGREAPEATAQQAATATFEASEQAAVVAAASVAADHVLSRSPRVTLEYLKQRSYGLSRSQTSRRTLLM
jgi:hypothetical protein